jgi:hypothetical protein
MESVNIAKNYEEGFEEYEQKSPLLMPSKIRPNRFFEGLIFAIPISLVIWGIIIFVLL